MQHIHASIENNDDTSGDNLKGELEVPITLQRKVGNEILNASLLIDKDNPIEPSTSSEFKKKEISWSDETYLEKVQLQKLGVRSATWMLERKTSVGPCYRQGPFATPSGITICLPKKSSRKVNIISEDSSAVRSGISITMSKRCLDNRSRPFEAYEIRRPTVDSESRIESDLAFKMKHDTDSNYCSNLRGKLDCLYGRIKHVLHI